MLDPRIEKKLNSERQAWIIAAACIGLVVGAFIGQFWLALTMSPVLQKIPNANANTTQQLTTTIPIPTNPTHGPVTHFAFQDEGLVGLHNPSANIWYLRWHSIVIIETLGRYGKLLVNYSFSLFNDDFYTEEKILEFQPSESKSNLEFLIGIVESLKDEVNYATIDIRLAGET